MGKSTVFPMNGNQLPPIPNFGESDGTPAHVGHPYSVPRRALYSLEETAILLGGVTPKHVEHLIAAGTLESIKLGRRRLVPAQGIASMIETLRAEAKAARAKAEAAA